MQRISRVCRLLPPRRHCGAPSTSSTLRPASRAVIAAHRPALPPPMTRTSVALGTPHTCGLVLDLAVRAEQAWPLAAQPLGFFRRGAHDGGERLQAVVRPAGVDDHAVVVVVLALLAGVRHR